MSRILLAILIISLSSRTASAQPPQPVLGPSYVPASVLENKAGKTYEPQYELPLSTAFLAEIADSIRSMPRFPDYLYSGCHDRAHAAYLLLPLSMQLNAMKIWVFAPYRFAPGISGTITLPENSSRATEVGANWGYHVALVFKDSTGGLHVYDPALAPERLISREQWFALMNIPPLSFWTLVPGWLYSFTSVPMTDETVLPRPEGLFSGGFFQYNNTALEERWIPRALARDAVGEAVANSDTCIELENLLTNPGEMQKRLDMHDLPSSCAPQMQLFDSELTKWTDLLDNG